MLRPGHSGLIHRVLDGEVHGKNLGNGKYFIQLTFSVSVFTFGCGMAWRDRSIEYIMCVFVHSVSWLLMHKYDYLGL